MRHGPCFLSLFFHHAKWLLGSPDYYRVCFRTELNLELFKAVGTKGGRRDRGGGDLPTLDFGRYVNPIPAGVGGRIGPPLSPFRPSTGSGVVLTVTKRKRAEVRLLEKTPSCFFPK